MPGKSVRLEDLDRELRQVDGMIREALVMGLRTSAHRLHAEVVKQMGEVKPWTPVDTGTLRGAWQVTPLSDGAAVENPTPYAAIMEYGTRPFMPPIGPLREWARRKMRGKTVPMRKGERGPARRIGSKSEREQLAESLATRAQWSIFRYGIRGRGFWRATLTKAPKIVESSIDFHMRRVR